MVKVKKRKKKKHELSKFSCRLRSSLLEGLDQGFLRLRLRSALKGAYIIFLWNHPLLIQIGRAR